MATTRNYKVVSSPYQEDQNLPWSYSEDNFISWVDEVFREGYKRENPPLSAEGAVALLENIGYTLSVSWCSDR